jgi:hypothetical protein
VRHAASDRLVDVERWMTEFGIDREEDRLPLGLVAATRRVILAELRRGQHGGNQSLGKQREIQVNRYGYSPSPGRDDPLLWRRLSRRKVLGVPEKYHRLR